MSVKASPARKRTPKPPVPLDAVVGLFRQNLKRGPWPNAAQCYYLMNTIAVVANALPAKVLNADPSYRRRRATISALERLICAQLKVESYPGILLPGEIEATQALQELEKALKEARSALLAPFDHLAGERKGAAWHKPARFIAGRVEEAMVKAGRKKVSFDKHSPLVRVVIGAMVLAGQRERSSEAVAAALAASPPPKYV